MRKNKIKLIIDTDPGIDDSMALTFFLKRSDLFDIKLISVSGANVGVDYCIQNVLHLLHKLKREDVRVVIGAPQPLVGKGREAKDIHGIIGLGGYVFDEKYDTSNIPTNYEDIIYDMIKKEPDITMVELGGMSTIGGLLRKHKDAVKYIKRIVAEGGSGYGQFGNKPYISFNASYDPYSTKLVYESGAPITLVTSEVGRWKTYFTQTNLRQIARTGEVGAFFGLMLSKYLTDYTSKKIVQNNDLNVVMYFMYPRLYKTMHADIQVEDKGKLAGKMTFVPKTRSKNVIIYDVVDRESFFNKFITQLKKITF